MATLWSRYKALGASLLAMLLALACAMAPAQAASPFDGRWVVTIRSTAAHCQTGGGYRLRIRNGLVSYRGLASVSVGGRVDRRGWVRVRLRRGDRWALAAGRLTRNAGTGMWYGRLEQRACAGRWRALRR